MKTNNKGLTLVEILVAVGISSILGLLIASFYSEFSKVIGRTSRVVDASIEFASGSVIIYSDLNRADPSLGVVNFSDENANNFFEFDPTANFSIAGAGARKDRKVTLAIKGPPGPRATKYQSAITEINFIVASKKWAAPLVISPTIAYKKTPPNCALDNDSCASITSKDDVTCTIGWPCLVDSLSNLELASFGVQAQAQNTSPLYFFRVPEYFPRTSGCSEEGPPMSYFFLAKKNAANELESVMNVAALSGVFNSKMFKASNICPQSVNPIDTLDKFFKFIPNSAGAGVNVLVQKVDWIKYKVEPIKLKGRDTTQLFRYNLNPVADGPSVSESNKFLIAEGFDAIEFTRPSVNTPIISFEFIRQFRLNEDSNVNLGL